MEESGRPRYGKHGGREREHGLGADDAETWRSPDLARGPNMRPDRGGPQEKRSHGGPYRASPRRGGGLLGSSPGGFKGGHSPSQRDGFRRFPGPENQPADGGREENWRERPQGRWGRGTRGEEQGEAEGGAHNSGGRRRNRDRRRGFADDDRVVIDESALSAKELLGLRQAEERIGRDEVFRLKKRSRSSPSALYCCSLCDTLLDSLAAAHRHVKDKWHKRRARERQEEAMLTEIAPPGPEQIVAIGNALEGVVSELGLSQQDVARRQTLVSTMQEVLLSVLPEIRLRLYGSSCSRLGFKDSDVNIDIQFPPHMHQPDVLLMVQDCLSKSVVYEDLEADFHARVPVVICTEKSSGLVCKVSAGNDNAWQTTSYLSALANQEALLLPLVLGFRHWARICHVDRAEEGGLPVYVLALMVVYFLQQRKDPVLPCYLDNQIKEFSISRLTDFSLTHLEDGYVHWGYHPVSKETVAKETSTPAENCFKKGKAPLVFQTPAPSSSSSRKAGLQWGETSGSSPSVGQLWVEMLRFYSLEFNFSDCVISVRTSVVLSREAKDWPKKRIAVEDPFAVKRNVARTLNSQLMYEYILHCLKTTFKYFALPLSMTTANHKLTVPKGPNHKPERSEGLSSKADLQASVDEGGVQSKLRALSLEARATNGPVEPTGLQDFDQDFDCVVEEEKEVGEKVQDSDSDEEEEKEKTDLGKSSLSEDDDDEEEEEEEDDEEDDVYGRPHLDSLTTEDEELFHLDEISGDELLSDEEGPDLDTPGSMDEEGGAELAPPTMPQQPVETTKPLCYEFNKQLFTRGKSHAVVCSLCKRDGHLKKDCPEDFKKVELDPLPPMTPKFLKTLDQVCEQCYRDFAPDELAIGVREHILQDLQNFVRRQFAGARLRLFGSSKNGFGFKQSDLDICMVLEGQETADDLDCISIIESLARLLRRHPGLSNILSITTAKVPIVKFYHVRTGLEGDISLYNTLALHNTELLASYAEIDSRVKILCYVMKVFAKVCDIGDASRGSLSSYAYTLMVLFYLQQRNPPVIPVLQEIYDEEEKPEVLVDGWNVHFYHDLEALPGRWAGQGRNVESVGSLWLGLLRFYTEDFLFRQHVISIRQQGALSTFTKQWTSRYISIEDPFDLNHNLGAGLSRRMTNFIMKAFISGRRLFGTPVKVYPPEYSSQMEYFFDQDVLTEGQLAPNDRCCRICGKIGHFMKDCPRSKRSKQRREQEDRAEKRSDWPESAEGARDTPPRKEERWRRQEVTRCCFLCRSHTHMKKDCPQYRGSTKADSSFSSPPSSSHLRNLREKDRQGSPLQDERKKRHQNVVLSPQAGSLASRHQGRAGQRRSPVD